MKKVLMIMVVIAVCMFTCQMAKGDGKCAIPEMWRTPDLNAGINIQFGRLPLVPSRIHVQVPGFDGHFGFPRPYYRPPVIRYYKPYVVPRYRYYHYMSPYGSGVYMIRPLG